MAETDFAPIYGNTDPTLRPSLVSRQSGAGWRAPGFIGRSLAGSQPQTAPTQGAQSSGDAMAAMRGLYAARSNEDMGVGNSQGAISAGQQPTREAQSFNDLLASAAMGGLALTGPGGFGAYMNAMDRRGNQTNPVTFSEVKGAVNPFGSGNSVIGRAAGAAYDSVFGPGTPSMDQPLQGPNLDGSTVDRSIQGPNLDGSAGMGPSQGPNMDGSTVDMGPVQGPTEAGPTVDVGGAGAGSSSDPGPSTQGDPTGGQGPEHLRNGGPIGKPGSKPMPRPIMAHTGEFMQRPEAVNKYGPSAMHALNSLKAPAQAVKAATGAAPAKKGPPPPAKKGPPAKGKAPEKKGGSAMDALARMKAKG